MKSIYMKFSQLKNYLFVFLFFFYSHAISQTVYPDLDSILTCSQNFITNNAKIIKSSNKTYIVSGKELSPCQLYTTTLNDYSLIIEKSNKDSKTIHAYLITNSKLTDNDIATLKEIAKNSIGYLPAYLDNNFNIITYFHEFKIIKGKEEKILMQKTSPFLIAKEVVVAPQNNLILEIFLDIEH